MKNQLMAAAAVLALMSASTVAYADDQTDVKALKAQAAQLKKQNADLEKRLNKIEKQEAAVRPVSAQQQPAPTDFMGMITKGPVELPDGPICWQGICIFGTVDAGLGYATHGAPNSSQFYAGDVLMQKFYNHANFGVLPSGLSQSSIGIKGEHEFLPGWSGVFYANTGFNPQSGQLANAPGAQVANNGVPLANQSMNIDGTRGGQAFNDQLYAGVASPTFGTLTFGRHKTFSNDLLANYDPAGGAYNYSPIGYSGTPVAGLGETDLGRIDDTLKYRVEYGPAHFGAMYKFIDNNAGSLVSVVKGNTVFTPAKRDNDGFQFNLGGKYDGFELDGVVSHFNQALTYGTINGPGAQVIGTGNTATGGYTFNNANLNMLSGTVADITSFMVTGKYTWDRFKFYGGYAQDNYANPADPMGYGANTGQGNYSVVSANNFAFPHIKILSTEWGGVKYAWDANTDISAEYYHIGQNDFGTTGQRATCNLPRTSASTAISGSSPRSGNCGGDENIVSAYVDHHFNKHFDVYAGFMWSGYSGGLAAGSLYTDNFVPSAGARFTF